LPTRWATHRSFGTGGRAQDQTTVTPSCKDGETPLFDGLGSERTVTNSSQAVTASLTLSAFGQTVASSGSSTSAYMFGATSGYRTEGDAGLTLVGCRFYDAQVGRFITRDTYLNQRPYAYCDGDPINGTDPTGHSVLIKILGGVLILGGLGLIVSGGVILVTGVPIAFTPPYWPGIVITVAGVGFVALGVGAVYLGLAAWQSP